MLFSFILITSFIVSGSTKKKRIRNIGPSPLISYPCGFFDGATAGNIGGAGFVIHLNATYFISFSLGCGRSTNTRFELLALWAILKVNKLMGIPMHLIFGDSLVIISWLNRLASLNVPSLSHWCDDILSMLRFTPSVIFKHIYREHNKQADGLSKQAMKMDMGFGFFSKSLDGMIIDHGQFKIF